MAEPVKELPISQDDDESGAVFLQRWIEHPDGRFEMLMWPLTPEDFLNPQPEDIMTQGELHARARWQLADLLDRHFRPNALVLEDVIHQLGPGLPSPSPDVSVILGARPGRRDSFSVTAEGVLPDLIIEIVSPSRKEIRRVDEVNKVDAYSRAGIAEYLLIDLPRRGNAYQLGIKGYRLAAGGRYSPIEPDARGGLQCKATGLSFFIQGDRVRVVDDRTGRPLLYSDEEQARRVAAEDETARLREELARLKGKIS